MLRIMKRIIGETSNRIKMLYFYLANHVTVYARTQRFVKANGNRLESFSFFSLDFSKADDLHKRKKTKFFTQHSFPTSLSVRYSCSKFFARIKFITFVKKTTWKSRNQATRPYCVYVYRDSLSRSILRCMYAYSTLRGIDISEKNGWETLVKLDTCLEGYCIEPLSI